MFDIMEPWDNRPIAKRRKSKKRYSPRKPTAKRPISYKNTVKGAKATYKGAKIAYGIVRQGYGGSAETEYKRREAKFAKARKEAEYRKKLKSEYGVKSPGEKLKGFFKKKKSIYR